MASGNNIGGSKGIPDWLSLIGPIAGLFMLPKYPESPNLGSIGISKKDITSFFNLKRAIARAGAYRQGAQASRALAGSLPASLRQSTIPASMQANLQGRIEDQIAQVESELAGQEMQARFKLYDILQQEWQNKMQMATSKSETKFDILDALSLIPLFL